MNFNKRSRNFISPDYRAIFMSISEIEGEEVKLTAVVLPQEMYTVNQALQNTSGNILSTDIRTFVCCAHTIIKPEFN